jgi:drug/metabolite transporter (DMT)-like permease
MGVVAPLAALSTLIPLGIAFIEGERVSAIQVVGMVIALAGAFMASGPELRGVTIKPILLGLSAALFFGISLTFLWKGAEQNALLTMVSMRVASVSIVLSVAIMPALIFVGSADFLANLTLGIATTQGLASVAFVLGSLFPIVTALLAFGIHKERLLRVQYLGIVAAVAGVATIAAN